MLEVLAHRSFGSFVSLVALLTLSPHLIAGQLINGQTFTNGLAVIDSPSPLNPGHAGSAINIAVDVSGDGKLSPSASLPGSGLATSYNSLEIYLVSSQANINMTVVADQSFLTGESGSTVKHLNWPIPTCIPDGNYNLTFYESSQFNGQGVFTITPIPIPISNPSPSGQCTTGVNPLQAQPQASNPLPQSPFAPSKSGMTTVIGGGPSPLQTLTLTLSGGVLNLPTITVTSQAAPTPTTVVLISVATVTQTDQGIPTTFIQTATITTVIPTGTAGSSSGQSDTSGFIPVNTGSHLISSTPLCLFLGAWTLSYILLYFR